MRRFEPDTRRVRRLRSSFTIPTSPGRNARTVSGFNRRPIYAQAATAVFAPRLAEPSLGPEGRSPSRMSEIAAHGRNLQIAAGRCVLQDRIIRHMNDLSKDAVNWLAVGEDGAGQRVDNYLAKILKGVPKSHVYRILRSGEVRVNRRRVGPDTRLNVGDQLRIPPIRASAPSRSGPPVAAPGGALPPILFEDDALIALDKPAGLAVHGGSGISFGVIERIRRARPAAPFLELVHRLDRDTSGVLLIAKKRLALVGLHAQLRDGAIDKRYSVLVRGKWRDAMRKVELPLTTYVTADGERRVRVDAGGRLARTVFRGLDVLAERRSAGQPARRRARHRTHAPDPRPSDAPRLPARRRRQVRRLRVEQGARAPGAQADVPARAPDRLRASAERRRARHRSAARSGSRRVRRAT